MKINITTAFFLALLSFASLTAQAQTRTVTGKVTAANDGQVLPGVNISVKDTTTVGTITDVDGNYSLQIPDSKNVLVFSYVGFVKKEIAVGNRQVINVELQEATAQLSNIVVVGYGSQLERDLTGSVSDVKGADIQDQPVNSLEKAIQGRTAGVRVNAGNAKLGQAIEVRIRGSASISASNQPLYVVDGVPVTSESLSSTSGAGRTNPIASLDMSNIESISVLKDASASAIYGSRASNGVVIITTKSGQSGATKFDVSYQVSTSSPSNKKDFMNAGQYVGFMREAAVGGGKYDYKLNPGDWNSQQEAVDYYVNNYYTPTMNSIASGNDWQNNPTNYNWQDAAFQKGASQNFKVSASGGNDQTTFFAGGGFSNQEGILIDNAYQKFSGRLNLDHKASDKLQLGLKISLNRTINDRLADDDQFETPMQAVAQAPISPFFADGNLMQDGYQQGSEYNTDTYYYNNLDITYNSSFRTRQFHTLGNANAEYSIIPNLSFKSKFGLDVIDQNEEYYYKPRLSYYVGAHGQGYNATTEVQNYTFENTLRYKKTLAEKNDIDAVLGTSYNWVMNSVTAVQGENFPSGDFRNIDNAADITFGDVTDTDYRFLSYFARANYAYNDRYLLTLSGRIDGSSRFGANNKYGFFPAASVGWIVSDEDFLKNSNVLSFFKIRASYGVTGNADISNFPSLGLYDGISYAGASALAPSQTPNPDLKWETTRQLDLGIDYGFFDSRISGEIDYYQKKTTDLLLNVNVPGTSGFSSQLRNVGKLQNEGLEFTVNSTNVTGLFSWSTNFNISFNANKITDLNGQILTGGYVNRAMEGQPIGVFYTYKYAGVNPANGDALYYLNHDPTDAQLSNGDAFKVDGQFNDQYVTNNSNVADRTVIGDPNPDFTGGFDNTFSLKGFSLDVLFQFDYGNKIYNGGWYQSQNGYYFDNQTTNQLNAWKQPGDITDVPEARLYWNNGASTSSSRYLSDGSYIRLKSLSLSYDLPKTLLTRMNIRNAKLYLIGTNLLTFTKYDGWDPEVNTDYINDNLSLGNDFYAAPQPSTISVGIKLGL